MKASVSIFKTSEQNYSQKINMVSVVNLPVYLKDDPLLQVDRDFQTVNSHTVAGLQRILTTDPTIRASIELSINHVFSGNVSISMVGGELQPQMGDIVDSWKGEIKNVLIELALYGLGAIVISASRHVNSFPMHTFVLQYRYTIDRDVEYRAILNNSLFSRGNVEGMDPETRLAKSTFLLFVSERPDAYPSAETGTPGGVCSRFRSVTNALSYLQSIRSAVLSNAFQSANPLVATELKTGNAGARSADPNDINDLTRHGERQNVALNNLAEVQRFQMAAAISASALARANLGQDSSSGSGLCLCFSSFIFFFEIKLINRAKKN